MRICFICHANICRSFMSQEILKKLLKEKGIEAEVFSMGVYARENMSVPGKVKAYLSSCGIPFSGHTPQLVNEAGLAGADIVLVMESGQQEQLLERFSQYSDKILLLTDFALGKEADIEDPVTLEGRSFTKAAQKLHDIIAKVADRLAKSL